MVSISEFWMDILHKTEVKSKAALDWWQEKNNKCTKLDYRSLILDVNSLYIQPTSLCCLHQANVVMHQQFVKVRRRKVIYLLRMINISDASFMGNTFSIKFLYCNPHDGGWVYTVNILWGGSNILNHQIILNF